MRFSILTSCLLIALSVAAPKTLLADSPETKAIVEEVTFDMDGVTHRVPGRVLIEDSRGGMLLESLGGQQWIIQGDEVTSRQRTDQEFVALTSDQMSEQMLAELPEGFRIHTTPHYVICYNTSRAYAQWTSSLLERLHRAFVNYWTSKGIELHEPEFPLVVVIYATQQEYRQASAKDLGGASSSVIGYYSVATNRINMYDLTGTQASRDGAARRGSLKEINQMLSRPAAMPQVATIVHEATHQIAFNCGLQTRYAEIPLWLAEGMAVYFEAPDLSSRRGWRGIGSVNYPRLNTFRKNLNSQGKSRLTSLVADDKRFRNSRTAIAAYADAWALNYFLIRFHSDEYVKYLQHLSEKSPLKTSTPEERLAEFREHFGDPADLEQEFLRRMLEVR